MQSPLDFQAALDADRAHRNVPRCRLAREIEAHRRQRALVEASLLRRPPASPNVLPEPRWGAR